MANKKVSQLTSKPSVLTTDLFPIADPSTGQLYKTTISDLGTAIGSGVSSVNSLVGAVVLDTDDIQELVSPTNKWFTDTRARAAISAGTGISYNSGTGVITNAVTSGQIATALGYTPANGANYLPLAGGTMGGAIFGTIATFESSSSVTALGITLSGSSGDGIKITHSAGRAFNIQSSGSGYGLIINNETASTSIPFVIQKAGANKITFTDAGGATYSDRINTPTLYATGSSSEAAVTIYQNSGYHALSITQAGVGAAIYADGKIFANQFIRIGGASTSFLKADGSVDTNTYLTTSSASSTYLPLSGGTLTGALSGTSATFSGFVGIGASASYNLDVVSASDASLFQVKSTATANNTALRIGIDANTSFINATGSSTGILELRTYGTPKLTIQATGAATFSSSVNVGNFLTVSAASTLLAPSSGKSIEMVYRTDGANDYAFIQAYDRTNSVFKRLDLNSAVTILASGNVGIGTTAPLNATGYTSISLNNATNGGILDYQQNGTSVMRVGNNGTTVAFIETRTATPLTISTNDTERMRITSGGYTKSTVDGTYYGASGSYHETRSNLNDWISVISNTASSPYGLFLQYTAGSPNGTGNEFIYCRDSSLTLRASIRSNGGIANYQANNVNLSDERTKKEISPLESYWNKFKALEIVKFKYKDQTHDDFNIGVIAQQVESVAPEFVDADGWEKESSFETPLKSIYTADLYHASIGVLKEAMAKIETLEAKIKTLENK